MNSKEILVEELIKDEYFHKWLIDPDQECIDFWVQWGNEGSERNQCIEDAKEVLLSFRFETSSISQGKRDMLWENITDQIEKSPNQQSNRHRLLWYSIAAAVTLLLMMVFSYKSYQNYFSEKEIQKIAFIEKIAPKGKISSFEFEDGTVIKLFPESKIRFPEKFSDHDRKIYLEGEGFFEVKKDVNRPFIVETNSLLTYALGTSFNIRTYQNRNKCDVSLVTGKVKVERVNKLKNIDDGIILLPGEEAVFEDEEVVKQLFIIDEVVAWKDGYIYLEDKNFEESLQILKRWFEVEFEVKNGYRADGKKGIGKFKNQSLYNILQVIGYSFDFKFDIKDDKAKITF